MFSEVEVDKQPKTLLNHLSSVLGSVHKAE